MVRDTKEKLPAKDRTKFMLDETRIVLPGTQALVGFQLSAFFSNRFPNIAESLQYLHLASVAFTILGVVLLMAPVAYHQIVDKGEDTENFITFTRKILVATLVILAIGLSLDIFVVFSLTVKNQVLAYAAAGLLFVFTYVLWFAYTTFKRQAKD